MVATKKNTRQSNTKRKSSSRKTRKKKEYSKILVGSVLIGVTFFIIWCCRVIDPVQTPDAFEKLIGCVCATGMIALMCYAYRCKQKDKVDIEMERLHNINEMKKRYGEDFIFEEMTDVNTDYPSL